MLWLLNQIGQTENIDFLQPFEADFKEELDKVLLGKHVQHKLATPHYALSQKKKSFLFEKNIRNKM